MFLNTGAEPKALGTAHAFSVTWQAFQTVDGWIVVAVREEKFWRTYCTAIDMPELLADARFASNALRVSNRSALIPLLAERMLTRTTAAWLEVLSETVPVAPVRSVAEALGDDALTQSGDIVDVPYGPLGSVRMLRNPVRFDGEAIPYAPPPGLGAHTSEVLSSAGMSDQQIAELDDAEALSNRDAS
jgi:crotonobetainyl-CoA:carnitine CoA-transferase CaiB-like acyl-CoA transferase